MSTASHVESNEHDAVAWLGGIGLLVPGAETPEAPSADRVWRLSSVPKSADDPGHGVTLALLPEGVSRDQPSDELRRRGAWLLFQWPGDSAMDTEPATSPMWGTPTPGSEAVVVRGHPAYQFTARYEGDKDRARFCRIQWSEPVGARFRWLTVVGPEAACGNQVLLAFANRLTEFGA